MRGRFRNFLAENARELSDDWAMNGADAPDERETERLRSLYASYRMDQVAHFIALVEPDAFERAVDHILDGELVDFRAKDRLQFAMMVVEHIERRLPLPTFDVWAADFRANVEAYRLYAHTLHREGRLP